MRPIVDRPPPAMPGVVVGRYAPPAVDTGPPDTRAGPTAGEARMTPESIAHPWDQAERLARAIIALSGAGLAIWALLRWPVTVLLKAALLAAVKAVLRDDESRATLVRLLREQLLAADVARMAETAERLQVLERTKARRRGGT